MKSPRINRLQRFTEAVTMVVGSPRMSEITAILDIGFGSVHEIEALTEMFPNARVRAIEIDGRKVSVAQTRSRANWPEKVVVVERDAQNLSVREISTAQFVVIRHPNVSDNATAWSLTFRRVATHLTGNAVLVFSTYSLLELAAVQDILADARISEVPGAPYSKHPIALDGGDRYIVAYAQKSQVANWRHLEELCR